MSKPKIEPPDSTPPSDKRLDAGLAVAFGSDPAFLEGPTGSFLASPTSRLHNLPRVRLRKSVEDDPVVESYEMPLHLESTGRYVFLGEIGRGGMGLILWAHDTALGCELAIKVLGAKYRNEPHARERFVEEAQIAGQLQHPGIVPVHELGEFIDGRPYMTMKLVKGRTLAHLLAAREDVSQDRPRFLGIFEQICQTLAYAHSRGVIHRDLKPANVMVGAFGEVQVMDWGLAKVLTEVDFELPVKSRTDQGEVGHAPSPDMPDAETLAETDWPHATRLATRAGTIMGTLAYISPEQVRGEIERTDERSDVFGLGAILCHVLTGAPPYVGENVAEVQQRAENVDLADAFQRLDQCGSDDTLILLTKHCLDPALANRPRHAGVLAEELEAYQQSVQDRLRQTELENVEVRAKATHERKLRWMTVTLAATVVLFGALAAGGGLWVQQDRQIQITATNRRLEAELREEQEKAVRAVTDFFSSADLTSDQVLPQLEQMVDTSLGDSPFVEAMFLQTISSTYVSMKQYEPALKNAETAVELLTAHAGAESPATVAARDHLERVQELFSPHLGNWTPRAQATSDVTENGVDAVIFRPSYAAAVLADSPLGYWRLNEAAGEEFAHDTSRNGNHLRYNGTKATEHGATSFQSAGLGTADFVQGPFLDFPGSSLTIEFWLTTTAQNDYSSIISYAAYTGSSNEVAIDYEDAHGLRLYIAGRGEHSGVRVNDGRWHHIVVAWQASDGSFQFYKDGLPVFTEYVTTTRPLYPRGSLAFAQEQDSPVGDFEASQSYQGQLAEVAVYDTILSADRVAAHYQAAFTVSGKPLKIAATEGLTATQNNRIVQTIEAGDGTEHSDYKTIGRPSARDYADLSVGAVTLTDFEPLHGSSGKTDSLRDGLCQSNRNSPRQSLVFADGITNGLLLMDLGREVEVTRINTYTWGADDASDDWRHNGRAAQRYTLYGSNAQTPPTYNGPFWTRRPWTMITRVDTDQSFSVPSSGSWADRPEQQAVSITSRDGVVAKVRFLLFRVSPVEQWFPEFGEIDVYADPPGIAKPTVALDSEENVSGRAMTIAASGTGGDKIIQTIEAGQGVREADYTTIGRPSGEDFADLSTESVTLAAIGTLYLSSGTTDVLRDGSGQTHNDSSNESLFFTDDTANGCLLMDLGHKVPVAKINTYTWHANADGFDTHGRAAQQYVLYGSKVATPPSTDGEFWTNDEWTEISRVDTDAYFSVPKDGSNRPGQQAVSTTSRDGIVANVRYLLWRLSPSHRQPFLGEIDVYVGPDS